MRLVLLSVVAVLWIASAASTNALSGVEESSSCRWCHSLARTVAEKANQRGEDAQLHTDMLEAFCASGHIGEQQDWGECVERAQSLSPMLSELLTIGHNEMSACLVANACEKDMHDVRLQSNTTCALCEFVVSVLQDLLADNATEQDAIKALELVCSKMPVTIRQECTVFVDKWGPSIIQLIMAKLDPQLVCREINICPHQLEQESDQLDIPVEDKREN